MGLSDDLIHMLVVHGASRIELLNFFLAVEKGTHLNDCACAQMLPCRAFRLLPGVGPSDGASGVQSQRQRKKGLIGVDGEIVPSEPLQCWMSRQALVLSPWSSD